MVTDRAESRPSDLPAPTILDRAIAWLFPAWGLARTEARAWARELQTVESIRTRTVPNPGPLEESAATRQSKLSLGRRLAATNEYAIGVVNSIVDNVVGSVVRFESRLRTRAGQPRISQNQEIERAFRNWAKRVNPAGTRSLQELTRMVESEKWIAGECLIVRSLSRDGREVPLALELVESERLADVSTDGPGPTGAEELDSRTSGTVYQGVEYAPDGRILAYHIYPSNPSDSLFQVRPRRVLAENVIHQFVPDRPGKVRGTSRTGPLYSTFESVNTLMNYELAKAKSSSALAVLLKRGGSRGTRVLPSPQGAPDTDAQGNMLGHLYGGLIVTGGPNDSIESAASTASAAFDPFIRVNLRRLAVGLNVSYEILARDFSAHNFSSIRQSFLEDRRHWEPRQVALTAALMRIFEWFVGAATLAGIGAVARITARDMDRMFFGFAGWDWVDPLKERQADALGIKTGLQDPIETASRHGSDYFENIARLGEIQAAYERFGITPPSEIFESGQQEAAQTESQGDPSIAADDEAPREIA